MKTKIILLSLCTSMLFSCDYYKEKKTKEEAIKREEVRKEREAIAKQKAIEEEEAKKQDMKNNIAKYVYIKKNGFKYDLHNDTDYTIDEIVYEHYIDTRLLPNGKTEQHTIIERYIAAHTIKTIGSYSSIGGTTDVKIISIKCKALGLE